MSILSRVQINPEILTNNAAYVADLIERAKEFIVRNANLPRFPELVAGTSVSKAAAGEDLTALVTNEILVSVNRSGFREIDLTLANCDTGSNTAAELQTQIRADDTDGFDEVTVAFAATQYTITSGRFGESSAVNIWFNEDRNDVVKTMKLSPTYGGVEDNGSAFCEAAEDLAVMVTEAMYTQLGLEGIQFGMVPWGTQFNLAKLGIPPEGLEILRGLRRMW